MQGQGVGSNDGTVTAFGTSNKEWAVLWGLYSKNDPQHQEALCADLLQLPAAHINRYLLQYVYMAVARPSGPLERAVTQLCGRSFNIAVQVSWLLRALLQDQPGNRHIRIFKDACERAALTGTWMSPFEQAAMQADEQQQQQQEQLQQQYQQEQKQEGVPKQQDDAAQQLHQQQPWQLDDQPLSPIHNLVLSRSSPPDTGTAAAAAGGGGGCSTPSSPTGSSVSLAGLAAVSSRSSLDLAHKSSVDLAHRFRNSLDLELMRHTSSQDLHAAASAPAGSAQHTAEPPAAAAAGKRPGKAGSKRSSEEQQQQTGRHGLPKVKTRLSAGTSGSSSTQAAAATTAGKMFSTISEESSSTGNASAVAGQSQLYTSSSSIGSSAKPDWGAVPGSIAAQCSCFEDYLSVKRQQLQAELGSDEGVSELIEASHEVALSNGPEGIGWLVTHEEELSDFLSMSVLLSQPPRSPAQAAARDSYLATLDFVEALCETSSSLTRFPPADRQHVLKHCLARISQEVEAAAAQGVSVKWPVGGCTNRVLRLLVEEAAIMNSREKAPFLLLLETQAEAASKQEQPPAAALAAAAAEQVLSGNGSTAGAAAEGAMPSEAGVREPSSADHSQQQQQQQKSSSPCRARSPPKASPLRRTSHADELPSSATAGAVAAAAEGGAAVQQQTTGSSDLSEWRQQLLDVLHQPTTPRQQQQKQQQQQPTSPRRQQQQQQQQEQEVEPLMQRSCPSIVELQMQEAAAVLRGEHATQLVRVQIRVQQDLQDQGFASYPAVQTPISPGSPGGPFSPNTQRRALMSGEQQWHQQQQQQQQRRRRHQQQQHHDSEGSSDEAVEPFVFGEVPAPAAAAAASSTRTLGRRSSSSPGFIAAAAAADSRTGPVRLLIEVVDPSVVPRLALPQGPNQRGKQRRRLPSMEAIDIIAGKLGRSALPDPADIGPPLHPDSPSVCSSRRSSSELLAAEAAVIAMASGSSSNSSTGGGSVHMPAVLEGVPAAAETPDALVIDSSSKYAAEDWQHVRAPAPPAAAAAAAAAAGGHASSVGGKVTPRRYSWAAGQQQSPQQQQPPTSPGLWGRLFGGGRQQQQQYPLSPQVDKNQDGVYNQQQEQQQEQQQYMSPAEAAAAAAEQSRKAAATVFGERWTKASSRAQAASPYGEAPGWGLRGAIVKSGDDCRQELLALQLIRELQDIWAAAGLPLWVRPFGVLVTSADTAIIELIPDAISIHTVKARARRSSSIGSRHSSSGTAAPGAAAAVPARSAIRELNLSQKAPPRVRHSYSGAGSGGSNGISGRPPAAAAAAAAAAGPPPRQPPSPSMSTASASGSSQANLADFFFARWQRGTAECLAAQRRFVESLAGYSLATYFLQVKDRHNGNIMLDASGHLIHIDFGFMLSNVPGGNWVRFEAAPMKLTRELLEVMDSDSEGTPSVLFDYFKVLCIQGFLAARKERHRLVGLVRIMADCCRVPCPGMPHPAWPTPGGTADRHAVPLRGSPNSLKTTPQGSNPGPSSNSGSSRQGVVGEAGAGSSSVSSKQKGRVIAVPAVAAATAGEVKGSSAASWPCFIAGGDRVVSALEARFVPGMSESACVQHVLWLISTSLDAWTTRTYDYYQLVLNGIL